MYVSSDQPTAAGEFNVYSKTGLRVSGKNDGEKKKKIKKTM